ncbi:hypothetical protein [Parabacteroides distasonis]|uniref:hypothetical protein n=1 Tax=Parabacteroides distasonis TaxID=823 RepID=UPI00232F75F9|nr:hypothetical protein [Parabacteroides distasonis]
MKVIRTCLYSSFVTILFFVRLACILHSLPLNDHSPSLNDRSVAANMEYIGSQETLYAQG